MSFILKSNLPTDKTSQYFTTGVLGVSAMSLMGGLMGIDYDNLVEGDHLRSNLVNNVIMSTYSLVKYYFGETDFAPAAMLAGIPLPSTQELSHAISNRELKYRATGGVFLAHQEGGNESLRIVGQAFGPNRFVFLTMLDFLFLYGLGSQIDLIGEQAQNMFGNATSPEFSMEFSPMAGPAGVSLRQTGETPIEEFEEELPEATTDPWQPLYESAIDEGLAETHLTFPVITRNRVYTNMYIETYDYTESVENGMDVVEYSIFLRKYTPPRHQKVVAVPPEGEDDFDISGKKGKDLDWFYREHGDEDIQRANRNYSIAYAGMDLFYSALLLGYRTMLMASQNSYSNELTIARIFGIRTVDRNSGKITPKEMAHLFGIPI